MDKISTIVLNCFDITRPISTEDMTRRVNAILISAGRNRVTDSCVRYHLHKWNELGIVSRENVGWGYYIRYMWTFDGIPF